MTSRIHALHAHNSPFESGEGALNRHIADLVDYGWTPKSISSNSASLSCPAPFSWPLFLVSTFFLPVLGGLIYLAFWSMRRDATLFLHREQGGVTISGDTWLAERQREAQLQFDMDKQDIRDRGYLRVMWPHLAMTAGLFLIWLSGLIWIMRAIMT